MRTMGLFKIQFISLQKYFVDCFKLVYGLSRGHVYGFMCAAMGITSQAWVDGRLKLPPYNHKFRGTNQLTLTGLYTVLLCFVIIQNVVVTL